MTDVKPKTPNKRKSLPQNTQTSAKKIKQEASPNKLKQTPAKNANGLPGPKKLQKFKGTTQLEKTKKTPKKEVIVKEESPKKKKIIKREIKSGENTDDKKKRKSQFFDLKQKVKGGNSELVDGIQKKIKVIESRKELTKTAKRKLSLLKKLLREAQGKPPLAKKEASQIDGKKQSKSTKRRLRKKALKAKLGDGASQKKIKKEEDDDDDQSEEELEEEEESDEGEEEESGDGEGDEEESGDEEEEEESDDEEVPETKASVNLNEHQKSVTGKKSQKRWVVFVGNIPYDTTTSDLKAHFLNVGNIKHIRIPTEKGSNKPRGFAYVEVDNDNSYQKCMSMHHSTLKGRRINIMYTEGGKKKGEDQKKKIKAKNFKLHAMRKQGKLAGSIKEKNKRAFRRLRRKHLQKSPETE